MNAPQWRSWRTKALDALAGVVLSSLAFCVLLLLALSSSFAHEAGGVDYRDWKQPNGISCCNNQDCRKTKAKWEQGAWWVWEYGMWLRVPEERWLKNTPNPDGNAHVCIMDLSTYGYWDYGEPPKPGADSYVILCFLPGESKF